MSESIEDLNEAYATRFNRRFRQRLMDEGPGFIAKYPGKCENCGKWFRKGRLIRPGEKPNTYVHAQDDCEDVEDEEFEYKETSEFANYEEIGKKPEGVCSRCFTVHAGDCL